MMKFWSGFNCFIVLLLLLLVVVGRKFWSMSRSGNFQVLYIQREQKELRKRKERAQLGYKYRVNQSVGRSVTEGRGQSIDQLL